MSTQGSSSSRSRNPNRKKNEDASYIGPSASSSSGLKRQAADRIDGETSRVKRKKVEPVPVASKVPENDNRISMVDFVKMPSPFIHRYLTTFDLVPSLRPLPNSPDEPPPPFSLGPNFQQPSRAPSPVHTPANRPRRDPKEQSRRRSSRSSEDDVIYNRTPILADVHELHLVLAGVAEKHFREMTPINGRVEVDTLAAFMCAVEKTKGGKSK